jgi:hypothetical protein
MNSAAKALFKTISIIMFLWIIPIGCRTGSVSPPPPATLVSLSISPANPSIAPGTTIQLTAQGTFSNGAKQNLTSSVTWSSSNTAIATVAPAGLVSAVLSTIGTTTISASYGGISGSTTLTSSDLATIAVTPADQTIASGTAIQYTATGNLVNTATQNISAFVTWGSNDTNKVDISVSGLATAGTATGTATISAAFNSITGSTSLTSADVASIAVAPPDATIILGTKQQYSATGTLATAGSPTQNLTSWATWTSSQQSVATISNTGLATSQGTGTTFIAAAYALVTSNTATLVVNPATLLTIAVTPVSASVPLGRTQQFTATGTFSNNTTQDLTSVATWFSSNALVSTVSNTVGSKGLATTLETGTAAISAQFSGVTSNSATLTVTAPELVSITVFPLNPTASITTSPFQQFQFQAIGLFTDTSILDLTTSVSWSSSNLSVATINIPGLPGRAALLSKGTTTITATSATTSGSTLLTVTE